MTVLVLVTLRRVLLQNRGPYFFWLQINIVLVSGDITGGIATLERPAPVLHQQITGVITSHRAEIKLNKTQSLGSQSDLVALTGESRRRG